MKERDAAGQAGLTELIAQCEAYRNTETVCDECKTTSAEYDEAGECKCCGECGHLECECPEEEIEEEIDWAGLEADYRYESWRDDRD
jgi:hypothetical protein